MPRGRLSYCPRGVRARRRGGGGITPAGGTPARHWRPSVSPRDPWCARGARSRPQSRHRSRRTGIAPESLALLTPSSLPAVSDAAPRARASRTHGRSQRSHTSRSAARARQQTIHGSGNLSVARFVHGGRFWGPSTKRSISRWRSFGYPARRRSPWCRPHRSARSAHRRMIQSSGSNSVARSVRKTRARSGIIAG